MAIQVFRSIKAANDKIERLKHATKTARAKSGELMENVLHSTESVGAAFGFGFLEGRTTKKSQFEIGGVPLPLAVGGLAKLFAVLGVGRGMESHLNAVGTGALAAHFNGVGRQLGRKALQKSNPEAYNDPEIQADPGHAYPLRGASGAAPRQGSGVTESELARMIS